MQYLVQPLFPHSATSPLRGGNEARVFTISSLNSGFALTAVGNNLQLQQLNWQENTNQQWKIIANGDGTYRIASVGSGQVMDVSGGGGEGTPVLVWDWHGGNNQRWRVSEIENGMFRIDSALGGSTLDVFGASVEPGAVVVVWGWNGGDNQRWVLAEVRPESVVYQPKATLFQHSDYGGTSQEVGLGSYDINDLSVGNDQISSLKVPAGVRVTLYEHANFRGRHWSYTQDTPWIGDEPNDLTSGVMVEKVATIYQHNDYQGQAVYLGVGRYLMKDIPLANDNLSSLKVPQGLVVMLYEHENFGGDFRSYYEDSPNVGDFNDKTSSIVIKQLGVVVPKDVLRFGDGIQLKGTHGKWLVAESDGRVRADRGAADTWETFTLVRSGGTLDNSLVSFGDIVSLRSTHGKYLTAETNGDATANSADINAAQQWQIVRSGATTSSNFLAVGDHISLKSVANNLYLVAEDNGDANANRGSIGSWEIFEVTGVATEATPEEGSGSACGAEACGADACGADACGADACGAAACGAAASLVGVCGVAAAGIAICGADVAGIGVCLGAASGASACGLDVCGGAACGAAACGAAATGIGACGADACGAAACAAAACGGAVCGAAACGADACGADASGVGGCAANACGADAGGVDACPADACAANVCGINACPADACAADACALDIIPIIPGI
ncbi:Cys-every-fifth RiPP peptide CefA [Methylomagnum ishizawai]|uniref:Cys-every-fifth RiPP peptide CefA n=1 Tax=Methylomagnum ishizawai TaxID=1760988 RepID=UPI001C820D1B|nr:Cys-every-fifth RiPP peptide CefA [Methylomagnum ishizawai]